jgi:hypothetical protein
VWGKDGCVEVDNRSAVAWFHSNGWSLGMDGAEKERKGKKRKGRSVVVVLLHQASIDGR